MKLEVPRDIFQIQSVKSKMYRLSFPEITGNEGYDVFVDHLAEALRDYPPYNFHGHDLMTSEIGTPSQGHIESILGGLNIEFQPMVRFDPDSGSARGFLRFGTEADLVLAKVALS
jgi:hypothetical protein